MTVNEYRRAGGIPQVALGEDRAFFEALRHVDARIRHAPEVRVVVSGRIVGRAAGGMADTIRRRIIQPDKMLDDRLEPAFNATWRACLRKFARAAWGIREELAPRLPVLSRALLMPSEEIRKAMSLPHFGAAWARIESRSPKLVKRRVAVVDLEYEIERARQILHACAEGGGLDSALFASASPGGTSALDDGAEAGPRHRKLRDSAQPLRVPGMDSRSDQSNAPAG